MNTNEPTQNPNQQPGPRKSIARVIVMILGIGLVALPLYSILCSVLNLPSFSWIFLVIIAITVLVCCRSLAKKSPAPSSASLQQTGPRPHAIFGGISLACGAAELGCFAAGYLFDRGSTSNAALDIAIVGFLLTFPTMGCALVGIARREQPKWPAAVGGLIGASPFVIAIMLGIYTQIKIILGL